MGLRRFVIRLADNPQKSKKTHCIFDIKWYSACPLFKFMSDTRHPAKAFGAWLKAKRQAKGIIARIFAGQVWLTPSKYAEVEVGVVKWVGINQEANISRLLELVETELATFTQLLSKARTASALTFESIFSKDDLKPVRAAHSLGKQISLAEENALLEIVFKPLPA